MPAEIVKERLLPALHQEEITLMDDFGKEFIAYVHFGQDRAAVIAEKIAMLNALEAEVEAYGAKHGKQAEVDALRTAGLAAKAARKSENGLA